MRVDSLRPLLVSVLLLVGALAVGSTPAPAQESAPSDTREAAEAPPPGRANPADERSPGGAEPAEFSDAEHLLRMQQVVTSDEAKLERLRTDLESRRSFLDLLTGRMADFQATRDEMRGRLGGLDPASGEASALRDELSRLEHEYERYNRHATLTFEAESALRRQIDSLQEKIETDRQALAAVRGSRTIEAEAGAAPAQPATPSTPPPAFSPVPGLPSEIPTASPAGRSRPLLPETTEQIAARQELERKSGAARLAEQALVTFVKRTEAVEVQIGLEQTLLRVDEEALENLAGFMREREEWREARMGAGAGDAELSGLDAQIERLKAEWQRVSDGVSHRRVDLASLEERLGYATGEQERIAEVVEERRREAEAARRRLVWLESPLYPGNLSRWALERGPRVLAVLLLAGLVLLLIRFSLRRIARAVVTKSRKVRSSAVNRADTLALSFQSLATTLILAACVLLVLQEAGIDVKTVLGGAAILGVAIAFGAQNLMRDYFTGFMMLLEDQYELGDLVTIGSITGTVERVNMRVTMLRDLEGRVHFIPNGQIGSLTNRTYDWARALVEIPVGPEQDVDLVMALLLDVARGLKADPEWSEEIVDEPQMLGVDKFTESGVIIKLLLKTQPERMFPIRRELLRRIKKAFDEAGIRPGFPQRVVREPPPGED
ncbi:MAG: mechanosensitive ion channel family protein [Acidobacteria bacterium]|nr:mechanosensitive ion channel family protein [Acidobacteriota bacterium]